MASMTRTPAVQTRRDAAAIIGFYSRRALAVASALVVAAAVVTVWSIGLQARLVPALVSVGLLAVGVVALMTVRGDPMPLRTAAMVAALPACQSAVLCPSLPVPFDVPVQAAPSVGGGALLCVFLCVRGRVLCAWAGQLGALTVLVTWTTASGQSAALAIGIFVSNAGVLLMATFFALLMRPAVATLFELWEQRAEVDAERAATEAVQIERARQQSRLEEWARPMLTRIAENELDADGLEEAWLLEALLRDNIRARALDVPEINRAAWAARARGVAVQLFDDGGLDAADTHTRVRLHTEIVSCLDAATEGAVTVRVQPPNRPILATIRTAAKGPATTTEYSVESLAPPGPPPGS